jgi:two-component system, NtrC family, sensor kinase
MQNNSVEDIIDKSLMLIDHDLEIKGIQLEKIIEPDLPNVRCDFKQIQQALLNLVYNASDAMQDGGGILTVKAVRKDGDGGFLALTISDVGCGIAQKNKEKIFDPFFTTKEEGKGVGLGLSVVYGIIARHNGSIEVESEEGKGSTFRISLPFAE